MAVHIERVCVLLVVVAVVGVTAQVQIQQRSNNYDQRESMMSRFYRSINKIKAGSTNKTPQPSLADLSGAGNIRNCYFSPVQCLLPVGKRDGFSSKFDFSHDLSRFIKFLAARNTPE